MSIIKIILYIIGMIITIFCSLFGLLLFIIGLSDPIISMAVCGGIIMIASVFGTIFIGKRLSKITRYKNQIKHDVVFEDSAIIDKTQLEAQVSPEQKLQQQIVENPHISLYDGEVCYYCNTASAIHQKNIVTERISGGAGVSLRVAKGISIRTGGGNSQVIRENVNEYFDGTLYITNIRIILLSPKYGFDIYISKITQLLYKDFGLEIFSGSKCYQVFTTDGENIRKLVELMNSQRVFKDEKWLKEHSNDISFTTSNIVKEIEETENNVSAKNIDKLSGLEFENWCATLLKNNGFENVEVTKSSGDQGVDILAQKNDIKYAIQCKCYSTDLGNSPVQEVHAGKSMYGCHVAVVMTNRHFTSGAKELAKATGVLLWDREKLLEMMSNTVKNNKNVDLANAIEVVLQEGSATASLLQRKLKVGYAYAARLVETMEKMGIISEFIGDKPREIIMSKTDIEAMLNKLKYERKNEKGISDSCRFICNFNCIHRMWKCK